MKTNFKRFELYIISIFFIFTGLISLSIGFKDTIEVQAGTIPDGYATDPINAAADELVWIPDQNLRRFLETKVGVGVNADITVQHMRNITTNSWNDMKLDSKNISNLNGIEFAINVRHLSMGNNKINDISPLSSMTNLIRLYLHNNMISDITTMGNMTKLETLILRNNAIKSIPENLNNFTNLRYLDMRNIYLTGELPNFLESLPYIKYWDGDNNPETSWYTSFSGNYLTGTVPSKLKAKLGASAFDGNILENENNQKQLTLLPGAKLNLSLNSSLTSNTLKSITKLFDGQDSNSKSIYELELVPTDSTFFDESGKAIKSGTTTAYIKIKGVADSNTYARTLNVVAINISNKVGSINDTIIDFSIENSLEVSLGTNIVDFGVISSEGGEVQRTTLTVTSSLPYDISTMAHNDFIGSLDSDNIIPIDKISLDVDSLGYMPLSKAKTLTVGDNISALNKIHNLSLKMEDTIGYKKDNYNTLIQFIVDTK